MRRYLQKNGRSYSERGKIRCGDENELHERIAQRPAQFLAQIAAIHHRPGRDGDSGTDNRVASSLHDPIPATCFDKKGDHHGEDEHPDTYEYLQRPPEPQINDLLDAPPPTEGQGHSRPRHHQWKDFECRRGEVPSPANPDLPTRSQARQRGPHRMKAGKTAGNEPHEQGFQSLKATNDKVQSHENG